MRILSLDLTNFRSYRHLHLDFVNDRTLIVGENGAGKSTIVDAIALALTGRCRGVNGKGEGQKELVRTGATEAKINMVVEGVGEIVRIIDVRHGATSNFPTDQILGRLRTTEAMVTAAIYGSTFFELHHADAKALLMRLLDVQIQVPADRRTTEGGTELITLDEADRRFKIAFDERASLKRELAGVAVPDVIRRVDLEGMDEAVLAQQIAAARDAYESVVQATSDVRARSVELTNRLEALTKAKSDPHTLRVKIDTHRGMADEHQNQAAIAAERLMDLENTQVEPLATLGARVQELRLFVQRVEAVATGPAAKKPKKGAPVPMATCVLGSGIPCLTPPKEFQDALGRARADIKDLEARVKAGTAAAEAIAAARQELRSADQNCTYHTNQVAELMKHLESEHARAAEAATVQADLDAIFEDVASANSKQLTHRTKLDELTGKQLELVKYQAELKQQADGQARKAKLAKDVADAEEQVKLLGPTGVRVQALQSALGDFHQAINAALVPFGFTMTISVDPWRVTVKHGATAAPIDFHLLSKGQRIWTGLAFQLALAVVSGLDFVVVDDVEGVVGKSLQVLSGLVMAAPVKQVLIVKAQADDQPLPTIEGLQTLRMDGAAA